MAKYKAYPEYKDSGVEWLGETPLNWHIHSLKRAVDSCTNGVWGGEPDDKHDLIVLRVADFERQSFKISDSKLTTRSILPKDRGSRLLKKGDLLIEKSGGGEKTLVGCVVLFDKEYEAVTSNFVAKMSPRESYDSHFLTYVFSQLYAGKVNYPSIKQTTGIQNLDADAYLMEKFCFPPMHEQRNISCFLDYETAKIDNLIEKQQQLIELLKEKRQAVISHAVTKGLNPDVPMKDSGVEWLGDIPKHWIPARLKYHTRQIVDGAHFTPTYTEKGIPFLRVTDIQDKYIDFDNIKFIPEHEHKELIKRCRPENGDLLLSKNGTIGVPKLVDWDWEFSIFVSLCLIKFKSTLTPEYSEFYFKSHEIKEQIFGLIKQSTVINLHLDKIQNFWFCIPPLEEQYKIVNYLNEKIDTLECLIENAELTIRLAQERRTALISAAVTGKIDVRDWVASDTQDIEELQETAV
ncbi:restriction endonuclease subunit S [Snodgrassella sp. B3088]|uniref:restriction endonuclease subunit S n=1 Tax=unclassified Snodgrassella TaxID=2625236 RepID=UPI002269DDD5|nr:MULTISPECIES: restriction endonuclease subunit S [unclassified Snodgrassella]MCX8748876.1 restriction endonuclease subunit S [Snodgrassella sp. B3088]MCX8753221.1 restriction endonuclease subunit S [Snodgrassella sp. B3837]